MAKKDVLIRNVDDSVYRRAKAVAASKGITLGNAVDEALAFWTKETENSGLDSEVDANIKFVRSNWERIFKSKKGKVVVVAEGRLQGVFSNYDKARTLASKKKVALVFEVDKLPTEREVELGAELEVQS